jgi:glutathione synthase/RimK-type ligase-like ATP-grasp enzyme
MPSLSPDDVHLLAALRAADVHARLLAWDAPAGAWEQADSVLLRTPWDYTERLPEFLGWLDRMEAGGKTVWNPAPLVRWNSDKRYMIELEARGVPVVPTRLLMPGTPTLANVMDEEKWPEVVVKPAVGAGGRNTFRVRPDEAREPRPGVAALLASAPTIVQPYMEEVTSQGEWSLVFFDGEFSHALVKRPAEGEFRIQQLYGGTVEPAQPTRDQIRQAKRVLDAVDEPLLYARVDGVMRDGNLVLMELEIIEPELFFRTSKGSAERMVEPIQARLKRMI